MNPTFGSLFRGIGGFDVAFERAGFLPAWGVEIDKDCNRVCRRHWPDVPVHEDVRSVGRDNLSPVDVILGGFPCQGLSVAGQRRGLSDERSGLFYEMLRIIDELKPSYVVWENVPGLLTSCSCQSCQRRCADCGLLVGADDESCDACGSGKLRGRVFPSHRGADFFAIVSSFGLIGLDGAWTLLDSRWFGVPQRRRRLFGVFAQRHLGAERCSEVLSFATRMLGDIETSGEAGAGTPRHSPEGTSGGIGFTNSGFGGFVESVGSKRSNGGDVGPGSENIVVSTLQGGGKRGWNIGAEDAAGGDLVPTVADAPEVARCETSSNERIDYETETFVALTNRGEVVEEEAHETLRAASHGALPLVLDDQGGNQFSVSEGLEPTPRSEAHGNIPSIIAIQNGARPREYSQGLGVTEDGPMYTLDTFGEHAVLHVPDEAPVYAFDSKASQSFQVDEDVSPTVKVGSATAGGAPPPAVFSVDDGTERIVNTLRANAGAPKHAADESKLVVAFDTAQITSNVNRTRVEPGLPSSTLASNSQMHAAGAFGVRRLTPRECERLQAFEDDWTAKDADGKSIADSARYRMLGNAVTVSTVRWIADRMYAVMNQDISCQP